MSTSCWIYKSLKHEEMYLYVPDENDFDNVPEPLLSSMGALAFVMHLTLSAERTLARENTEKVIKNLNTQGFHLQMPPSRVTDPFDPPEDR